MIFKGRKVLDGVARGDPSARSGRTSCASARRPAWPLLDGMPGVASVADAGNVQDVRLTVDPQALPAARSRRRPTVLHFELKKPSLHDIFKAIAQPTEADLAPRRESPHDAHPHRRPHRVPGARPDEGVHHRHPDGAGAHRDLDRLHAVRRPAIGSRGPPRLRSSTTRACSLPLSRRRPRNTIGSRGRRHAHRTALPARATSRPTGGVPADLRAALSDRVRSRTLFAFVELPGTSARDRRRRRRRPAALLHRDAVLHVAA